MSETMTFSADELKTVDSVNEIRLHPKMYLPVDDVTGEYLASRLVADILVAQRHLAFAIHVDDWWVVASDADWIPHAKRMSIKDYFYQIVPFPEAGPNSMHAEVLITAFAKDVVTFAETQSCAIRGRTDDMVSCLVAGHPTWKRVVAFRMEAASDRLDPYLTNRST